MVSRALQRYLRISPKKLRPIADIIKKKKAEEAVYLLVNMNKRGASILKNVIQSAVSNAKRKQEKDFEEESLFVSKVIIDGGPTLKRYRAMSLGRAGMIRKRTSHVLVELDALKKSVKAPEAPPAKRKVKKLVKAGK